MISWFLGKKNTSSEKKHNEGDDFVSLSSHELRSPLSIIKWYTEILLDGDVGPLTDEQRKYLTVIESSNQRAIDLVKELLNVSRLDLGTFSISPETINFNLLVNDAIKAVTQEATKKNCKVVFENEISEINLDIDKKIATLVLKNILLNAILFSKQDGKIVVTVAEIPKQTSFKGAFIQDTSIVVSVTDSGIGIPENDIPHIFSKMFRASNVKDSNGSGPGLGLYIAKTVMNYVSGDIWFESKEGSGTTFYVSFPVRGMKRKEGKTTLD